MVKNCDIRSIFGNPRATIVTICAIRSILGNTRTTIVLNIYKLRLANMTDNSGETENISDLVASRSTSNTSLLNGSRNLAYASVERANLLNLSKLCIKNLIESSLKLGRSLGEDHKPLQQFFVIIEHVLRHGLRGKCRL